MKSELKIVLVNTILAIAFGEISAAHTILIIGREGFVEANPLADFLLGLNPAIAFIIPANESLGEEKEEDWIED